MPDHVLIPGGMVEATANLLAGCREEQSTLDGELMRLTIISKFADLFHLSGQEMIDFIDQCKGGGLFRT